MNFFPGKHADEAVIKPESFDARIRVEGLSSDALAGLFTGAAQARGRWVHPLGLTAGLDNASNAPVDTPYEKDLPDGRAILHSGAAGTVRVEPHHRLSDDLLQPQSLYLLLAQQWARAGLMLVHGAAFEFDGAGILALGDQGAGKSVLTASAMTAGASIVSDDWIMVGLDRSGRLRAERLRDFMMLRHGRTFDALKAKLPDLSWMPASARAKSVLHFRDQPDSVRRYCLSACTVDQIWLLKRPSAGRLEITESQPASRAQVLASIIRATMPVLFSRRFAPEAAQLRTTAEAACDCKRICAIGTGRDLVENAHRTLSGLI